MIHSVVFWRLGRTGVADAFVTAARDFAGECARCGVRVMYGGARVGLMGALADVLMAPLADVFLASLGLR